MSVYRRHIIKTIIIIIIIIIILQASKTKFLHAFLYLNLIGNFPNKFGLQRGNGSEFLKEYALKLASLEYVQKLGLLLIEFPLPGTELE